MSHLPTLVTLVLYVKSKELQEKACVSNQVVCNMYPLDIPSDIKVLYRGIKSMTNENIELQVLVNGKPVKTWGHEGRSYIEAHVGSEYSVKIRNSNSYRIEAVVTVDGVNVVSGKEGNWNDSGYIIEAFSSADIKGYRKDLSSVGSFKFTKKKKAYAKQVTGSTSNVGVIAVAVFKEKEKPQPTKEYIFVDKPVYIDRPVYPKPYWPYRPYRWQDDPYYSGTCTVNTLAGNVTLANDCSTTLNLCESDNVSSKGDMVRAFNSSSRGAGGQSAASSINYCATNSRMGETAKCASLVPDNLMAESSREAPKFSVGSSWGKEVEDKVITVSFIRDTSYPFCQFELFYDSRENLEEIGIDFMKTTKVSHPRGFPSGFATPPAAWRG